MLDRTEKPPKFHLRIEIPDASIEIGTVGLSDVLAEIILSDGPAFSQDDREVALIAMLCRFANLLQGDRNTGLTVTDLATGDVICNDGKIVSG